MTDVSSTRKFPASFGRSPRRVEDRAILTGKGQYPTDATAPGEAHAYVLRSSAGHARIMVEGLETARASPGVIGILTAADVAHLAPLSSFRMMKNRDGSEHWHPPYHVLASDTVRHVGEPIAFIVADTAVHARNASELIDVDYDPLPAITDIASALAPGAPIVWPEQGTNLLYDASVGDEAATKAARAKAARKIEIEIVNNRLIANYMEPRSVLAVFDPAADHFTVTLGSQGVHFMRDGLCKVLGLAPEKLRVITPPDVGGGFGTKFFVYREYPLAMEAAKRFGRPVRWIGDRSEHFLADCHGRDNLAKAVLALDADNKFIGLDIDLRCNMGAYLSEFGASLPGFGVPLSTGLYAIPAVHARIRCVMTNTQPVDAYRGAGRPEAAYLIERLVDKAARELGVPVDELRSRNFVQPDQMPYKNGIGRTYDVGEFEGHMRRGLQKAGWAGFEARAAHSKAAGKLRGIGLATYIEACAAGAEKGRMELTLEGRVQIYIGNQANGQGHRTAFAQMASDALGLDISEIDVIQGDTARIPTGGGTGGSKSVPLGAVIVDQASRRLSDELKKRASGELEAAVADLELAAGTVRVKGTDKSVSLQSIAAKAKDKGEVIESNGAFKVGEFTYPNGSHIAEIEIDPRTGETTLLAYTIVDDVGVTVNPMLLEGQIHGGVVQGLGQALLERTVFDGNGQLLTASLMDYCLPRADDVVQINFETRNVPGRSNPLGIKGAGEAGTIGAAPAVMNAVVDALWRHNGTTHIDMPATPEVVWRALNKKA